MIIAEIIHRRRVPIALLLAALLLLSGCALEEPKGTETAPTVNTIPIEPTMPDTTEDRKLLFVDYASYSGGYMEDMTDEPVESVAAVLVKNVSNEYLDYARLTFEIEGKQATFEVTGLAAGSSAWVLEKNRLQVGTDAKYRFVDSASGYLGGVICQSEELTVTPGEGILTVRNETEVTMHDVYVYYKRVHEDGNYFGGITYRRSIGTLQPGEQVELVAGHCTPTGCRIVRIEWNKEELKQ